MYQPAAVGTALDTEDREIRVSIDHGTVRIDLLGGVIFLTDPQATLLGSLVYLAHRVTQGIEPLPAAPPTYSCCGHCDHAVADEYPDRLPCPEGCNDGEIKARQETGA